MIAHMLRRDRRGSTTVEFAIIGWLLCMVLFAVIEAGLLWWTRSGLQVAAALTARCGAIGYAYGTSSCTTTATTQAYAVSTVQSWVTSNAVSTGDVTVNGQVTSCNGFTGNFFSVTIQSTMLQGLPPPIGGKVLTSTACYPM